MLGLGGARKTLNCTEPAETKESWAGPAEDEGELGGTSGDEGELGGTSGDEGELDSVSSWDGAGSGADPASSWGERGLEWTLRAPGTERPGRTLRAPGTSGLWSGPCELLGRSGLWSGPCELLGRSGLWSGLLRAPGTERTMLVSVVCK